MAEKRWVWAAIQDDFKAGNVDFEGCVRLLLKIKMFCHEVYIQDILKNTLGKAWEEPITKEDFDIIYQALLHRSEFLDLFLGYSAGGKVLHVTGLVEFLIKEQFHTDARETTAWQIISKYEPIDEVREKKQMSFEGFARCMSSEECSVFQSQHRTVYQDMDRPLCDYFISSSHKTYLLSGQIKGRSQELGYAWYVDFDF